MSITRTMVINDAHIPFHDPKLIDIDASGLVLDILEDLKLDRLIINGDLLDMYNVNSHGPKHPDILSTLEDELYAGLEFFKNLRKKFPALEIVFLFGNHEWRLDRFLLQHAKQFFSLLSVENFLQLKEYNIEYYEYQVPYQLENTNCYIVHSPPSYGVNGARTSLLKKMDQDYIYGCTHREQKACLTASSGTVYTAYFNGWLGSTTLTPEHKRVYSYAKGHESWQQCFCIVTVVDGKEHHINQYSIRNNRVVVDGFLYEA